MTYDPKVEDALEGALKTLEDRFPDLHSIMERARKGEINEAEAMLLLMEASKGQEGDLEEAIGGALAPLKEDSAVEAPFHPDRKDVIYTGVGLPKLNPLIEAALIERAQFDGDMPELRTGPLPPGVKPAVPVLTDTRSAAALGSMLQAASEQVQQEIRDHEGNRLKEIGILDEGGQPDVEAIVKLGDDPVAVQVWGNQNTDLPTYRRGEEPAPLAVEKPSGAALAAMSPEERQRNAWLAISTTQGRRSALSTIREIVLTNLTNAGLKVSLGEGSPDPDAEVLSYHEWTLAMGGAASHQSNAGVIDMAARSIYKRLLQGLSEDCKGRSMTLEVIAVNTVDVRKVGWAGRLIPRS